MIMMRIMIIIIVFESKTTNGDAPDWPSLSWSPPSWQSISSPIAAISLDHSCVYWADGCPFIIVDTANGGKHVRWSNLNTSHARDDFSGQSQILSVLKHRVPKTLAFAFGSHSRSKTRRSSMRAPPTTRNFTGMGFPAERTEFFQVPKKLAQPFPAPELRAKHFTDTRTFLIITRKLNDANTDL